MACVKLYIPYGNRADIGAGLASTAARLGIELTHHTQDAAVCAFSDPEAQELAGRNHPRFVNSEAFFQLTDRIGMQQLGIPVVPTSLNPFDVDGALFIKHRRTYKANNHPLCYTSWDSAQSLMSAEGTSFKKYQENPDPLLGELIAQPLFQYPTTGVDVCFSVNQQSEVLFFAVCDISYASPGRSIAITSCELPYVLEQRLRSVCKRLNIRGGFHNADFTWFADDWCLTDWNARMPMGVAQGHAGHIGFVDDALRHMCGDVVEQKPLMYFEQRGYITQGIPISEYSRIVNATAFPRLRDYCIGTVSVVAESSEAARKTFDSLGSLYSRWG